MVTFRFGPINGAIDVPGDKSISHRALIVAARNDVPVSVWNLNPGRDVQATRDALLTLGAQVVTDPSGAVVVTGERLTDAATTLDCANSGSTARMMLGLCAGAGVRVEFDGDESLRRRPMEPVAAQLRAFGARIETSEGRLPVRVLGRNGLETRRFILLGPSAQVKSAILFAALFAGVSVQIDGDRGSRNHTERLLEFLGAEIEYDARSVRLGAAELAPREIHVAGDFSAAAFFVTAAAIAPGSSVTVRGAGVNPTRTGLLDALIAMGAHIELRNPRTGSGEPIADIYVEHRPLVAASFDAGLTLRAIDEIPLLALAAAFATGRTSIAGVGDLRTKESDRVAAIERLLALVEIGVEVGRTDLTIVGGTPSAPRGQLESRDDHRIVMAAAVLACAAGPVEVDRVDSVAVSFPGFLEALRGLQGA